VAQLYKETNSSVTEEKMRRRPKWIERNIKQILTTEGKPVWRNCIIKELRKIGYTERGIDSALKRLEEKRVISRMIDMRKKPPRTYFLFTKYLYPEFEEATVTSTTILEQAFEELVGKIGSEEYDHLATLLLKHSLGTLFLILVSLIIEASSIDNVGTRVNFIGRLIWPSLIFYITVISSLVNANQDILIRQLVLMQHQSFQEAKDILLRYRTLVHHERES